MPVIVVGADTPIGRRIVAALTHPDREVRAFVSDADVAIALRDDGVKVALGDVSDPSHVGAACTNVFCAIFVTEAAVDDRERSFAPDAAAVLAGWAHAAEESGVSRLIWVGGHGPRVPIESAAVDPSLEDAVARVVALDDAEMLGP